MADSSRIGVCVAGCGCTPRKRGVTSMDGPDRRQVGGVGSPGCGPRGSIWDYYNDFDADHDYNFFAVDYNDGGTHHYHLDGPHHHYYRANDNNDTTDNDDDTADDYLNADHD